MHVCEIAYDTWVCAGSSAKSAVPSAPPSSQTSWQRHSGWALQPHPQFDACTLECFRSGSCMNVRSMHSMHHCWHHHQSTSRRSHTAAELVSSVDRDRSKKGMCMRPWDNTEVDQWSHAEREVKHLRQCFPTLHGGTAHCLTCFSAFPTLTHPHRLRERMLMSRLVWSGVLGIWLCASGTSVQKHCFKVTKDRQKAQVGLTQKRLRDWPCFACLLKAGSRKTKSEISVGELAWRLNTAQRYSLENRRECT